MRDQSDLRKPRPRRSRLPDALAAHGVDLDCALGGKQLGMAAYPTAPSRARCRGLELLLAPRFGTFGVERHRITCARPPTPARRRWRSGGRARGRRQVALEIREIARATGDGAVCTSGGVVCKPGIVTSVVETVEQLLDQRHLDAGKLASMLAAATEAATRFAGEERIAVEWERIWNIEPILFHSGLVDLCDEAVREVAGASHRLPSGPLHDAAEVARAGVPAVMMFVQSLRGLSHTKLEDTKDEHLELAVAALDRPASQTIPRVAELAPPRSRRSRSARGHVEHHERRRGRRPACDGLRTSPATIGLFTAALFVTHLLAQVPAGRAADRRRMTRRADLRGGSRGREPARSPHPTRYFSPRRARSSGSAAARGFVARRAGAARSSPLFQASTALTMAGAGCVAVVPTDDLLG